MILTLPCPTFSKDNPSQLMIHMIDLKLVQEAGKHGNPSSRKKIRQLPSRHNEHLKWLSHHSNRRRVRSRSRQDSRNLMWHSHHKKICLSHSVKATGLICSPDSRTILRNGRSPKAQASSRCRFYKINFKAQLYLK